MNKRGTNVANAIWRVSKLIFLARPTLDLMLVRVNVCYRHLNRNNSSSIILIAE